MTKLSPPAKDDGSPVDAGDQRHAEVDVGMFGDQRADGEGAEALLADLAVGEGQEVRAVVAGGTRRHEVLLDHVAVDIDGLAHLRRVERRRLAVGRQDVGAGAPDERREGEDHAAAAAAAGEVEAVGVVTERADLLGIGGRFRPRSSAPFPGSRPAFL